MVIRVAEFPIIGKHAHALPADAQGPPPLGFQLGAPLELDARVRDEVGSHRTRESPGNWLNQIAVISRSLSVWASRTFSSTQLAPATRTRQVGEARLKAVLALVVQAVATAAEVRAKTRSLLIRTMEA
jgi:hypothetical protein